MNKNTVIVWIQLGNEIVSSQLVTMFWLIFTYDYWKLICATVFLTGILLNVLVLIILFQQKSQRKSYFSLVKSLIFANMLLPLSSVILQWGSIILFQCCTLILSIHCHINGHCILFSCI